MNTRRLFAFCTALLCAATGLLSSCGTKTDADQKNETEDTTGMAFSSEAGTYGKMDFEAMTPLSSMTLTEAENTVIVTENGMTADDVTAASANRKALAAIIRKAKKNTAIVFPEGNYYMDSGFMSSIGLSKKEDLLFYGEGDAKLIQTSFDPVNHENSRGYSDLFVHMDDCRNVTFEGLTFDYLHHTTADGVITGVKDGYILFDVFDEYVSGDKKPLTGGEMLYRYNLFSHDGAIGKEAYYGDLQAYTLEKAEGGANSFRVYDSSPNIEKTPGQGICLQFSSYSPMFAISNTAGVTVRGCNIRSTAGIIFIFSDGKDLWLDHVTVAPEDGSEAFFATNCDVVHATNNRGRLEMTDCRFVGLGDDALNVLGTMLTVTDVPKDNTVPVKTENEWETVKDWAKAGDTVRCFDPFCRRCGEYRVVKCGRDSLTLDGLPEGIGKGWIFQNISNTPVVRVMNCEVSRGRARAFLIQTRQALIEGCHVDNMRLPAVLVSPDLDKWHEVGFTDYVLIKDNEFSRCCLNVNPYEAEYGVIQITGCHDFNLYPLMDTIESHGTIEITGNHISDSPRACAVYARSVQDFHYSDNKVSGGIRVPQWVGHPDYRGE